MPFCPDCDERVYYEDEYCANCGAALDLSTDDGGAGADEDPAAGERDWTVASDDAAWEDRMAAGDQAETDSAPEKATTDRTDGQDGGAASTAGSGGDTAGGSDGVGGDGGGTDGDGVGEELSVVVGLATSAVAYVFGLFFGLFGLALLFGSDSVWLLPGGALWALSGTVALPPVRRGVAAVSAVEFDYGLTVSVVGVLWFLGVVGLVAGAIVAPPDAVGDDVPDVAVTTENATPGDPAGVLEVDWNARAQSGIDEESGDANRRTAPDGSKYLVVRVRPANRGEAAVDLRPDRYALRVDGTVYRPQQVLSDDGLTGEVLSPADYTSGWLVFAVPEDATTATLFVADTGGDPLAVRFRHNEDLGILLSD